MDGLGGGGGNGGGSGGGDGAGIADNVVNSALRYRAQAPIVDALLKEIGIVGGDITKVAPPLVQPPAAKTE